MALYLHPLWAQIIIKSLASSVHQEVSGPQVFSHFLTQTVVSPALCTFALALFWDINLVLLWTNVDPLKIHAVSCLSINTHASNTKFAKTPFSTPLVYSVFFFFS